MKKLLLIVLFQVYHYFINYWYHLSLNNVAHLLLLGRYIINSHIYFNTLVKSFLLIYSFFLN